ncbi:MAG TPA: plastocyanin/azurin family copper-binding protein [Acidimicrobiales bacterium]|nr:plastocyanin/azurin family copper-binding protein [Acidimicrobiales bacterium]
MRKVAPLLLCVAALVLAACGASVTLPTGTGIPVLPPGHNVDVAHLSFIPQVIRIKAGESVTWRWDDGVVPHNVTFGDFHSPTQSRGFFTHTFDSPGTYYYVCTIHPQMHAEVIVTSG